MPKVPNVNLFLHGIVVGGISPSTAVNGYTKIIDIINFHDEADEMYMRSKAGIC